MVILIQQVWCVQRYRHICRSCRSKKETESKVESEEYSTHCYIYVNLNLYERRREREIVLEIHVVFDSINICILMYTYIELREL